MEKKATRIVETKNRELVDLRRYMKSANHSILCLGPMSKNCVDSVISFANRMRTPIPLISSRRQIESEEFGGGYVNSWNTKSYADYVKASDGGYVHLCRDHGGPWQGNGEIDLPRDEAMKRAKASLLEDLLSGFDILHLDPSVKGGSITDSAVLEMCFELYAFVCDIARKLGRRIEIEVGAEQQSGLYSDPQELVTFLKTLTRFCENENYQKPLFCVVQTGTLVKEMRNVGFTEGRRNESFDQRYSVESMEKAIRYLVDIACINGVFVKEHNGDYLSDGSMSVRRRLNVGAVNVAPELGVFESKTLVNLCIAEGLKTQLDAMLEVFYNSKKWSKWLCEVTEATDFERAIIAGHYTFSDPAFLAIKSDIQSVYRQKGLDVDTLIRDALTGQLQRMTWNLGYFHDPLAQRAFSNLERSVERIEAIGNDGVAYGVNPSSTPADVSENVVIDETP